MYLYEMSDEVHDYGAGNERTYTPNHFTRLMDKDDSTIYLVQWQKCASKITQHDL